MNQLILAITVMSNSYKSAFRSQSAEPQGPPPQAPSPNQGGPAPQPQSNQPGPHPGFQRSLSQPADAWGAETSPATSGIMVYTSTGVNFFSISCNKGHSTLGKERVDNHCYSCNRRNKGEPTDFDVNFLIERCYVTIWPHRCT